MKDNPTIADTIEREIRKNAGLIVEKMLRADMEPGEQKEAEDGPEPGADAGRSPDVSASIADEVTASKVGRGRR